jgi:hypothetical protein
VEGFDLGGGEGGHWATPHFRLFSVITGEDPVIQVPPSRSAANLDCRDKPRQPALTMKWRR